MDHMLRRMTSSQLTEWSAYERLTGPLDRRYEQEVLAGIHEQLQSINYLLGAAHFTNKDEPDNPVPVPIRYDRPEDVFATRTPVNPELETLTQERDNYRELMVTLEPGTAESKKYRALIQEVDEKLKELQGSS